MKTKNRLLLTSAMMLALVAVSGTTATYAWWVSTLAHEANLSDVTAAADAALTLTLNDKYNSTISGHAVTPTVSTLTDVTSKDGRKFHKAVLDSSGTGTPVDMKEVALKDGENKDALYATGIAYAVQFEAVLSLPVAEGLTYNIYLGAPQGKSLLADSTKENSVRMAVDNGSNVFVLGTSTNDKYQDTATTTASHTGYNDIKTNGVTMVSTAATEGSFGATVSEGKTTLCLGSIKKTSDAAANDIKITFTLWFEGALTQNGATGNSFAANLYFYAIRVA